MERLFEGKDRYITKGIEQRLPLALQLFLWKCLDDKITEKEPLDYLQVFKLQKYYDPSVSTSASLRITHSQEIPDRLSTYSLSDGSSAVEGTIFVINDGIVVTMLWADEY